MAEKKIEVQMATVGAAEAAAGVTQTTEAVKGLTAAQSESTEAAATAEEQQKTAATAELQRQQINIERARSLQQIAEKTAMVGKAVRESAEDFRNADPEMAATLETIATGMDNVAQASSAAAQGFAIAGPAGAAAGAALAVLGGQLRNLYEAYVELVQANADAGESFQTLADAEANHARQHEEAAARRLAAGFRKMLKEEADAAKELAIELAALDKIEASETRLATAKRDREDAAAIASGADPDAIKKKRIEDDANAEKERIDQALARQRDEANKAAGLAERAMRDAIAYRNMPGADFDKANEMDVEAGKQIEAAEKASRDYATARKIGTNDKQTIDERAAAKTEEIEAAAAKRNQAVIDQHNAENIQAEIDAQRKADEAAEKAGIATAKSGLNQSAAGAAAKFGIAADRAPTRAVGAALDRIGNSLDDGTSAAEIERLQQQFAKATAGLGGATVAALEKMLADLNAQAKRIATLEARSAANRPAGA
jgi:hypothetical protein